MSGEHKAFLSKLKKERAMVAATQTILLIAFCVLWEVAARLKWVDPFIFSQPSRVFSSFFSMIMGYDLLLHIGVTLWETIAGFILGTAIGAVVAVILWWNGFLRKVLAPYLVVLNSLPKTALAPILIVLFGNNIKSIIMTALLISVIVAVISILTGFVQVDPEKIRLIEILGGKKSQTLLKLVIPANISNIISAMKINVGLSFVGVIVGEFLVAREGLGYLIVYGSQTFKMDWVMMSIIILCVMAAILYQIIVLIEKRFKNWM
jgi:NitT/TauT family transport system permease protein